LKLICEEHGTAAKSISSDAIKQLQKYSWTGNIRELRNVIERLVILSEKTITDKDVVSFAGKV
jgi:DNA-binding NtrC family response regulator